MKTLLKFLVALGVVYVFPMAYAQVTPTGGTFTWPTITAVGTTEYLNLQAAGIVTQYTVSVAPNTVAPVTCTYRIEGSVDGVSWTTIDQVSPLSCASASTESFSSTPYPYIHVNVLTYSAGSGTGVVFSFNGVPPYTGGVPTSTQLQSAIGSGVYAPATCPLSNATNICITAAPYNASGAGATTTTTTAAVAAGATTVPVASCSTFNAGNGVLVTGAAIGTVSSCSGTSLVLTAGLSAAVASGAVVQHDETAAFNAAIAAIAATPGYTGTIWGPDGVYLVNGPLQDTAGANAILPMPTIPNYQANTLTDVSIKGFSLPGWNSSPYGFVIQTSATSGNLIGGYDSAAGGGFPGFTNVRLEMEKVTIVAPCNTNAVMVNATYLLGFQGRHMVVHTPCSTDTGTSSGGIFMPGVGNNVQNELDDVVATGFWKNYVLTEHTRAGSIYSGHSQNCFVFDNGTTTASVGDYLGNGVQVDYLWEQQCVNAIVGGSNPFHSPLHIGMADLESTSGNGVLDTSNVLYGDVNIEIPSSGGDTRPCNAMVSGAIHLEIHYINCQPEPPNPMENWTAQEGQGTIFVNSGLDFTNSMTTANVTYTSVGGFKRPVATFNGTTSTALAASATNTEFTGTLPFSVCATINDTNPSSSSQQSIASNLSASPAYTGWRLSVSTGWLTLGVISNFATPNAVQARTTNAVIVAGVTQKVCAAYDGSGNGSGIAMSVDGVPQPMTVENTPLTASAANTNPLTIGYDQNIAGDGFAGYIGDVHIYNYLLPIAK